MLLSRLISKVPLIKSCKASTQTIVLKSKLHNSVAPNPSAAAIPSAKSLYEDADASLWVKSPLQDVSTVVGYTVPEIIRENLGGWGHLPAFECASTGKIYTHDDVLRDSRGFAAALIRSGFKRGDVVAIVLPNVVEYPSVLFGIWEAGLIASPVNNAYSDEEIHRQLCLSDAVCVVAESETLESVRKSKERNPNIKSIVIVGEPHQGCHTFKEMANSDPSGVSLFKASASDVDTTTQVALLPFSSGTTGPPKGVELTHANLATNLIQCDPGKGISLIQTYSSGKTQERHVGLLPFFHAYGLSCLIHMSTYVGAHVMCMRKFDVDLFLQGVRRHKPTAFHLVTPLINHMVNSNNYGKNELAHAHTVLGGAAPIGASLIEKLLDKAGKYFFFQEGYGMSELSPVSHVLLPDTRNTKIGSCGSPVPGTITKIVDTDGTTLGRNQRGEICVKGPQVMKGYYKNEEATRNTIDADGWLHTGDIAYYDDDGCLFIVDRLKELIKVKGFQVAPSELEDLLRKHDKVEDVAIIGVSHPENGEAPRAYIVPKTGTQLSEDEVNAYLKPLISKHKQLRGGIEFRKSIPKAPSGKILRRELTDEYKSKHGQ
ncbi:putative 4-coumarate--CoA ligase 3 [Orchesella cincta]|uniref:Luciferin 4-monooxygenase n=1 Tax=Orchesella cincta TaxID=48709 RepID=A0A1D2MIH7_ORCCI|nr:putative 4-coumarate--CoA ligase 3 [Orchesella cincta]